MRPEQAKHIRRTMLIFGMAGVPTLDVSVYMMWSTLDLRSNGRSVLATVTDVERETSRSSEGGTSTTYRPTFEFEDESGRMHTVTTSSSTSWWDFRVGEQITVLYDTRDPSRARPTGFMSDWFVALLTGFLGVVFTTVGVVVFFKLMPKPESPDDSADAALHLD
ncbi:MAG: DUF3592 domain-containing protein [Planctomycetota bacterium]